ncbi:TPA: hypothetical protein OOG93_002485 [Morganella morganii]|uniref:hypothetical protein n=1 Tax=Morganella morganii TaxID=582 RepID=UPI000C7E2161|nr:hypothetical protein [Morganella morganii]HCR4429762.1 hypothetical protein [Morganella morganii]
MKKTCSAYECSNDIFTNAAQCVLHCEKHDYSHDFNNKSILRKFYDALIEYIADSIFKWPSAECSKVVDVESVKEYLRGGAVIGEVADFCNKTTIVFNSIYFPCRDERDPFDYLRVLKKFKGAHFNFCKFTAGSIDIPEVEAFFQDCEFYRNWSITRSKLLENINNVLYQNCKFKGDVSSYLGDDRIKSLDVSLFCDCSFDKGLLFGNIILNEPVFNNIDNTLVKVNRLQIENCKIESKFVLNNLKSNYLLIKDSEFKGKVELKDGAIDKVELINTNFNGLFDSYSTRYGDFFCFKNIFSDFVGFEKCKFADLQGDSELNNIAIFQYVTFISFTNFRNSKFSQGLDLKDANLKEAPNFLNVDLQSDNTNRETLRIIKNSFDKIGNHIEANKFFVLEMSKYKQELSKKPINQERFIFWLNKKASNFGQSYILPVAWIFLFSIVYYLLILGHESNLLYKLLPFGHQEINGVSNFFNGVSASIIPFKNLLREGMEFVSLLFYIIFASLIWQTVVAVKRHTRR